MVNLLLKSGANPDVIDKNGSSALHVAVKNGNLNSKYITVMLINIDQLID